MGAVPCCICISSPADDCAGVADAAAACLARIAGVDVGLYTTPLPAPGIGVYMAVACPDVVATSAALVCTGIVKPMLVMAYGTYRPTCERRLSICCDTTRASAVAMNSSIRAYVLACIRAFALSLHHASPVSAYSRFAV